MTYQERKIMFQEFTRFLGQNHALQAFLLNLYGQRGAITWKTYTESDARHFIVHSFEWAATKQGWDFWHNMHKKWIECLNDFIIEKMHN